MIKQWMGKGIFNNEILITIFFTLTVMTIYLPFKMSSYFLVPTLFLSYRHGAFSEVDAVLTKLFFWTLLFLLIFTLTSTDLSRSFKGMYDFLRGLSLFFVALTFGKMIEKFNNYIVLISSSVLIIVGNLFYLQTGFYGYHENPNNTAFMLTFLLLFTVPFYFEKKLCNKIWIMINVSGILLGGYLLVLTESRAAILGVLVSLLVVVLFSKEIRLEIRGSIAFLVSISAVIFFGFVNAKGFGWSERDGLWVGLFEATISERPFFGYGINTIKEVIQEKGLITLIAHNVYLEIFVTTGLLGVLMFSTIVIVLINHILKMKFYKNTTFYIGILGLFCFLIIGIFDLKFFSYRYIGILSIFLGFIYSQRILPFKK